MYLREGRPIGLFRRKFTDPTPQLCWYCSPCPFWVSAERNTTASNSALILSPSHSICGQLYGRARIQNCSLRRGAVKHKHAPPKSTYYRDQLLWLGTRIERLHQWCVQCAPVSGRRTRVFIRPAWHGHADRRAQTWRNSILSHRSKSDFCLQMAGIIQQSRRFSVVIVLGSRWYVRSRGTLHYIGIDCLS